MKMNENTVLITGGTTGIGYVGKTFAKMEQGADEIMPKR